jgi:tight adherence protein C
MQVACLISATIAAIIYMTIHFSRSGTYRDVLESLDHKEHFYKPYIGGALWLVDRLGLKGSRRYFAWLHQKVTMLHGSRYAAFYLKIHWASKILYFFLGFIIAGMIGFLSGAEGYEWIAIMPGMGVLLFFLADKTLDDSYKKKKLSLERDFPDFLSNLILLVNAGLTPRQAIERIVSERGSRKPLYDELQIALNDIRAGMTEREAYTDFSERCKVKEITNFVGILLQNLKIGGGQMLYELKRMGTECWDMRKNAARQMGEAAASKLMIPLALMFLAIILICMAPAVFELSNAI